MATKLKAIYAEVPVDLHERLRIQAIREKRSVSKIVEELVKGYLARNRNAKRGAA